MLCVYYWGDVMSENKIRNIAVMVAGTDEEYQASLLSGIAEAAKLYNFNISVFACFGGVLSNAEYDKGEYTIYSLINYDSFDGAILLTNTISDSASREAICKSVIEAGIPAAVLDSDQYPEFYNVRIDNIAAMHQIVDHVITVHGAKTLNYISGPMENPEARARYQAFQDVLAEHGIPIDEKRVFFGEFRPVDGKRAAEEMLANGLSLPDAVVSANDAMGLEALSVFVKNGIRVPEDIIVTGFDNTYFARYHNPSLTTVGRPLEEAGKACCELLNRIFNGETVEKVVTLSAAPVFQESCGCNNAEVNLNIRSYKSASYSMIQHFRNDTSMLSRLTLALSTNETAEDSIRIISQYLHEVGCQQCCICLCENWENAFFEHDDGTHTSNPQNKTYTERMSAPLIWTNGSVREVAHFERSDMFPLPLQTGGNISFFFPMHFRDRCLGYYIFTNTDFPTQSMLCHMLMISISHSFENIRKLINLNDAIRELDRLYVMDPLCGIYNRNGFLRLADQIFKRCCESHEPLMISFIDMDGLKLINDNYGHDEGDFALRKLASVIHENCIGNQICARFGGDEFIVIGSSFTEKQAAQFEQRFTRRIAEINAIIKKPYELGASIGTFITEVSPDMKLFSLITKADQIMYEQKKRKRTSRYLRKE